MTLYCFVWPSRFINKQEVSDASTRGTPVRIPLVEHGRNLGGPYSDNY